MRVLRAHDIERCCPMPDAIDAVADGFAALCDGRATVPLRPSVPLAAGGAALAMPASCAGSPYYSLKLVTVAPGNAARGLPLIAATVLLGDAATGAVLSVLDGAALTALRTGAAGGVAARALARADASVLALFGTGAQARTQLLAAAAVRRLRTVRVVSRRDDRAAAFRDWAAGRPELAGADVRVARADDAVRGAHLVVTATSSATPVLDGASLARGVHVTAVGSYRSDMRELDEATMRGARVFVDQRDAALHEAGELAGLRREDLTEIGEVIAGRSPGRRDDGERTVFKSVGNAIQDLVVAARAYDRARELGVGEELAWP